MTCHFCNLDIKLAFLMWFIWGPLYVSKQKLLFTFFDITTFWGDGELEKTEECPNSKQTVSCIELDFQSSACSLPFRQTVPTCSRASHHISQKVVTWGRKRNKHKLGPFLLLTSLFFLHTLAFCPSFTTTWAKMCLNLEKKIHNNGQLTFPRKQPRKFRTY